MGGEQFLFPASTSQVDILIVCYCFCNFPDTLWTLYWILYCILLKFCSVAWDHMYLMIFHITEIVHFHFSTLQNNYPVNLSLDLLRFIHQYSYDSHTKSLCDSNIISVKVSHTSSPKSHMIPTLVLLLIPSQFLLGFPNKFSEDSHLSSPFESYTNFSILLTSSPTVHTLWS